MAMNMKSAEQLQASDTQISREDQLKINNFSRTNLKYNELKIDIRGKIVDAKQVSLPFYKRPKS